MLTCPLLFYQEVSKTRRKQYCQFYRVNHFLSLFYVGELRVLFAGEATDQSYYGTVHGAMNSADREVKRLIKSTSIT